MNRRSRSGTFLAAGVVFSMVVSGPASAAGGGGGGGAPEVGSLYSDLVVALRAEDGTPLLKEYAVPAEDPADPPTVEYCVQPVSYERVPGVDPEVNPLDDRDVWVLPLQGEWLESPPDPLPVEEIEACDPQPQYAMFAVEAELERLNLTRTSDDVLARKIQDVETKLLLGDEIGLDPAGRIAVDGAALDASPEYAAIYKTLMTTGTIPGLPAEMTGPLAIPAGGAGTFDAYELAAVAIGTAAGKYVPITVDTIEYYNRTVGFTTTGPLPSWPGMYPFIGSEDPDPATPLPSDVLPGSEQFVDYSSFTYKRSETFVGSATWLDVPNLEWKVSPILDVADFTQLTKEPVADRTLTGPTAFAQMADDVRAVIVFLHENEVVLPGFYMDPVGVDTTDDQLARTTQPAVDLTSLPGQVFQTLPFQVTASLFNPWGGGDIAGGRVRIEVDAAEALTTDDLTASSSGVPVPFTADADGDLVGWWGPESGFPVTKGYHDSTTFDVEIADAAPSGEYGLTLELVDVADGNAVLAQAADTTTVHENAPAVLWGGEISSLGTQGSYIPVPVRVYSPDGGTGELTFTLTGPPNDPTTTLVEQLAAGDATVYGDDGTDMVAMPLTLDGSGALTGTWPATLRDGYTDLTWYLKVAETAPVGQYGIDVGITDGTDLAEAVHVSLAAPETHGEKPPDVGEDTTDPVVTLTLDGLADGTASFTITVNEDGSTLQCQLTSNGVAGSWTDCAAGAKSYANLAPGAHTLAVKATDLAGNSATYAVYFTVEAPPAPEPGPRSIAAKLSLKNNAKGNDVAFVNAPSAAAGATVKLFKVRKNGTLVRPAVLPAKAANGLGNARFVVRDPRKAGIQRYKAVVGRTASTLGDWTPVRRIR